MRLLFLIILINTSGYAMALETKIHPEWGCLYDTPTDPGTILILDKKKFLLHVFNETRSNVKYSPASTFKIVNSIIGIDSGILNDLGYIYKWDKINRRFPSWNKDHTLESAIKNSVFPVFSRIAAKIGRETMLEYLTKIEYGNLSISKNIDRFWLDNSLRASAMDQILFLSKLQDKDLPVKIKTQETVINLIAVSDKHNNVVFSKTGWAYDLNPQIGWWIGWHQNDKSNYIFAHNLTIRSDNDLPLRKNIIEYIFDKNGISTESTMNVSAECESKIKNSF